MIGISRTARVFACALLMTSGIHAMAAVDEDEARIEALMRAELAAAPPPAPGAAIAIAIAVAEPSAPVVAEVIAPPPAPPSPHDDWLVAPPQDGGVAFAELAQRIGRKVTIVTAGERIHRGTLREATARQLTLEVRRAGGNATYTLRREQVVRIEPR